MHGEPPVYHLETHKLSDLDRLMERAPRASHWHSRSISWSHLIDAPPTISLAVWHDMIYEISSCGGGRPVEGKQHIWLKFHATARSAVLSCMRSRPAGGPPSTSIKSIDRTAGRPVGRFHGNRNMC